ncbi:hypothetical protein ACHAP9_004329 [Verticillium nonalfalfae]
MSNYERSPAANGSSHVKAVDDHHRSRPEPLQAPLRQQLPSLSSLHGALRSPHDRAPFQFTGVKDYGSSLRDQRPAPVPALAQPTVAASTVTSEGLPSKDGLGPKIWTGTHFLPRFVRAAEVPGEGPCYFYDDGSHCKTVIDGEAVNPHWGVTKAGKPRKRLAIACITCREKKIKCDPDFPRCVQCEKFGRVCKFKNAASELVRPGSNSSASVSPRTTIRQASPEPPMSHKRMRLGFDSYSSTAADAPSMAHTPDTGKSNASWQHRPVIELPRIHEELLNRTWQPEPYASEHRIRH